MLTGKIAILDAGAQYGKVIDRRVRELNIQSEILPLNTSSKNLLQFDAFIISGGPQSVYGAKAPKFNPEIFSLGKPVLGICYGMQLMNYLSSGKVEKLGRREDGPCAISIDPKSSLFLGLNKKQDVLMSHGDSVTKLAKGFRIIAESNGIIAGLENSSKKLFGVQFHPEVDLTLNGQKILQNFLFGIAKLKPNYTIKNREQEAINYIKKTAGSDPVLVFVSGGVDSAVLAALVNKSLRKKQIFAVHIDTGLLRKNESKKVKIALLKIGVDLKIVNARNDFLAPLEGVLDPEQKRHIIGDKFMGIRKNVMKDLGLSLTKTFLAQGTLRPDLIESASSLASNNATTIKTHHNDSPEARKLRDSGKVLEPLKDYHKDEVRKLGKSLGLPLSLVNRQPFPGPGLAVRIICAEKPILENYDKIYKKLQKYSTDSISVTLLPIKSVGVQGDERSYGYVVGLSGNVSWKKLYEMAREIPKEVHGVNRIVYIFGKKVGVPIRSVTKTHINNEEIQQLQNADDLVNKILQKNKLNKKLAQVPVILLPIGFGKVGDRSIALRPFITNDFMTGLPAIPGKDIPERVVKSLVREILKVPGISRVVYDLTSKPPGTTEWE